jgi:hypothetical protein
VSVTGATGATGAGIRITVFLISNLLPSYFCGKILLKCARSQRFKSSLPHHFDVSRHRLLMSRVILYSIWIFLDLRIFHRRANTPSVFACSIVGVCNSESDQKVMNGYSWERI